MSEAKQIPPKLLRLLRSAPAVYFAFLLILTAQVGSLDFVEYQHLSYRWKDDHTLLVNGTVYPLPNP